MGEAWEEAISPEELPLLIDTFVKTVTLTSLSPRFYKITVQWYDPEWGVDERICFKPGNPALHWKAEEDELLRTNYPTATRDELMHLLPGRSYKAMKSRASFLRVKRAILEHGEHLIDTLCLKDIAVMEEYHANEEQVRQDDAANLFTWVASSP